MNHTTLKLRMTSKLKQLSVSLILLSCFAATSKVEAMEIDLYKINKLMVFKTEIEKQKQAFYTNISKVSQKGLQEEDLILIEKAFSNKILSINDLKRLNILGLKKYINTTIEDYSYEELTLLTSSIKTCVILIDACGIDNDYLERVKFLVSIGAKIDKAAIDQIDKTIETIDKYSGYYAPTNQEQKNQYIEIVKKTKQFLLEEKERQARIEEELEKERAKRMQLVGKDKIKDFFGQTKCSICQEEFTAETENLVKLPCGHIFNKDCVTQVFLSKDDQNNSYNNQCPNCRAKLTEDFIEKYFLSLLDKKRDDLDFKQQLLFYAAKKGSVDILKELFKKNSGVKVDVSAKISATKYYTQTGRLVTTENGEIVPEVIEKQETGWTPLHFAANESNKNTDNYGKRLETIKILIRNRAPFDEKNSMGLKPEDLITDEDLLMRFSLLCTSVDRSRQLYIPNF